MRYAARVAASTTYPRPILESTVCSRSGTGNLLVDGCRRDRGGDDALRVADRTGQLGRDAAFAQHEHPMAQAGDLLGLAGVEQDRLALPGQLGHQLVDVVFGRRIDPA